MNYKIHFSFQIGAYAKALDCGDLCNFTMKAKAMAANKDYSQIKMMMLFVHYNE